MREGQQDVLKHKPSPEDGASVAAHVPDKCVFIFVCLLIWNFTELSIQTPLVYNLLYTPQ